MDQSMEDIMSHMDHSAEMEHMEHMNHMNNMNVMSSNTVNRTGMNHSAHVMHHHHDMKGMDHSMHSMSMAMTFHGGITETILFDFWKTEHIGGFIGSFFAIYFMALAYEGLKYYRKHLLWNAYKGLQYCAVAPPDKGVANACVDETQIHPKMCSGPHIYQTLLHGFQVFVSYLLMLIFMTFNTWLCLAVVLGSATGYFLFGWRESVVVDFTEHCH